MHEVKSEALLVSDASAEHCIPPLSVLSIAPDADFYLTRHPGASSHSLQVALETENGVPV